MVTAALSTIPAVTAKTAMAKLRFLGWYENQKLYRHYMAFCWNAATPQDHGSHLKTLSSFRKKT
jgi:hypothetical protein